MSIIEMKVPSPGESITEVQIARWVKKEGDYVEKDEEICEIDSDKATLTLSAEASGTLHILVNEGDTVEVGKVVCTLDTSAKPIVEKVPANVVVMEEKTTPPKTVVPPTSDYAKGTPSPSAGKLMKEKTISSEQIEATGKGGRITKGDVWRAAAKSGATILQAGTRNVRTEKMSMLRKKVAERLVAVKQETAMLTTFNEVDMLPVMTLRKKYKDTFKEVHGVNLGFMSFFTKAVCEALKAFPAVNAQIAGQEIRYHDYCDIGIAVSAPKGLMVPVLRNAENMSLAEIERHIASLAAKAREGKISIEEMSGGTFTITNGGVFGSMLSTPIINPPQSAILGMHNIVERPVAVQGKVEIRPIMYVALSYDHRLIDGRESVGFLVTVKQLLEDPIKLLTGGEDPMKILLEI